MVSCPLPSMTIVCAIRPRHFFLLSAEKMWRIPRRSPSPSSPTSPIKTMSPSCSSSQFTSAEAIASNAATPLQLSEMLGPCSLPSLSLRTSMGVPGGKTVSICAQTATVGALCSLPAAVPKTLPSSSACTSFNPSSRNFLSSQAVRACSPKGGAGMRASSICQSVVSRSCARSQLKAACTSRREASSASCCLLLNTWISLVFGTVKMVHERKLALVAGGLGLTATVQDLGFGQATVRRLSALVYALDRVLVGFDAAL